ncbi:hypothetical protein ABZ208_29200 [Streptomyces sp. NPDC006208]|uniref:hypothetical protein n=1 Tax=Streptomyces sp. NPDC006208 TaxID=3156734 RepID=UPI0033BD32AE
MPFEDELGQALHRTGETLRPTDRPALVEGGLTRGRRRLARRRGAAVTGSVLALAVVGVTGAYTGGAFDGGGKDGAVEIASPSDPAGKDKKDGSAGAVTEERMLGTLKSLLPEGRIRQENGRGLEAGPGGRSMPPYASVVFDDGRGAAAVVLSLNTVVPDSEEAEEWVTCPSKALVPHDNCTSETLADGSKYMLFQGYVYPDKRVATKNWRATLVTPAGVLFDVTEYNAPGEKGTAVSRPNPPLTPSQMKALVTAGAWKPIAEDYAKTAAEPAGKPAGQGGGTSADAAHKTLASLLPEGMKVTDKGGDSGYGFVVVDDGKGKSFIQVNVQSGMSDVPGHWTGSVTTEPDGTRVMEEQQTDPDQKGGAGTVGWTVDTVRADGFRVVVMAFNAPGQGQDASRPEPALTMAQLRKLALDKSWLTYK